MIELAITMADSQVEQTVPAGRQVETTKHAERKILLSSSTAHGVGYILNHMLGKPIREAGVMLEGSQAFQMERNPRLRDAIADCQLAQRSIKENVNKLLVAKRVWLVISESGKISFKFSDKISERGSKKGTIVIEGEELKQILGALEDGIWQNLTVLVGNAETLGQTSRIRGVREDSQVVHRIVDPLLEVPDNFRNLSQIVITTDDKGESVWDLVSDRNRVMVG